jgi:hypothetical protein
MTMRKGRLFQDSVDAQVLGIEDADEPERRDSVLRLTTFDTLIGRAQTREKRASSPERNDAR